MFGAQAIMLGLRNIVVVGGMENMSQAPHLSKAARNGTRFGELVFTDAIQTVSFVY
jgi:acetyl-CoA C-acetyltransferase